TYKPVAEQTTKPTTEQQAINQAAVQAFIKGLGINDEDVEQRISRDLDFEQVGYLFRHSVQGILDLLYSRADIKNEMRMDMTTIQPIENNPLKFAIHVNDALHDLLCKQNKNYLPPEQALNEAYDDIRAHQIAVISGIQAAIHELLARFEPEKLSERLQKRSTIAASIPGLRKAKLWALFEELHETIQQEAHNDFSRLFGAAFADAYDQQIRVLRQNAKNKTSA
ncbi:MAG TPA: type VI secretion system-associated FHA domain protein TagH, partial [Thiothrix sp.]|nr:type VI secretion system-associated FHA domain protein TagH [Thiothrix sp.]